ALPRDGLERPVGEPGAALAGAALVGVRPRAARALSADGPPARGAASPAARPVLRGLPADREDRGRRGPARFPGPPGGPARARRPGRPAPPHRGGRPPGARAAPPPALAPR